MNASGAIIHNDSQLLLPASTEGIQYPSITQRRIRIPWYEGPVGKQMVKPEGYKAMINPVTGGTFSVVTDRYKLIPYQDSVNLVEECIRQNPEYGTPIRSVKFLQGGDTGKVPGAKMHVKWTFPEVQYDIGNGDLINPTVDLHSSYDTVWAFTLAFGAFRLICTNGLTVGVKVFFLKHKHTSGLNLEAVRRGLGSALDRFSDQVGLWKKWYDRIVTPDEYERTMGTLRSNNGLGKKAEEEVSNEVEVSSGIFLNDPMRYKTLTTWLFFNVLAQYITHKVKSEHKRMELNDRMRTAFARFN